MGFGVDIGNILQQYAGNGSQQSESVEQDFDQVSQHAETEDLQHGVSEAFRSDQTPPFGNMLGEMFGQANHEQRAGIMNQLLGAAGPGVIGSLLGVGGNRGLGGFLGDGAGSGAIGALLGKLRSGNGEGGAGNPQQMRVNADDMANLSPEQIQELASHAERENPGVVDHMSRFFAEHPEMLKALGGGLMAFMLGRMAQRRR